MKKFLTYSVVIATIFWSLGVSAVMPAAAAVLASYTPVAGDIVKSDGVGSAAGEVYYIGSDLKAYLFATNGTFVSWRSMLNSTGAVKPDYSVIKKIKQADFAKITLAGNVTVRPGAKLLKFANADTVYAVTPGAKLCSIANSATAVALYGANWSSMIAVVPGLLNSNYAIDSACALTATSNLPNGALFQYAGNTQTYLVADGKKRAVSSEAFTANGYKDSMIIKNVATTMTFTDGAALAAKEASLADVVVPGSSGGTVVTGGDLSAALSSDNPASATLASGTIYNKMIKVALTAGSKEVQVKGVTVTRTGIIANSSVSGVSAWDQEGNRKGDVMSSFNSSNQVVIGFGSNPIVVPAGETKTLTIAFNITGNSGTVGADVAAFDTNGTVSTVFPIKGNLMSMVDGSVSLSGVKVEGQAVGGNAASTDTANVEIGEVKEVAKVKITETQGRNDVQIEKVSFYMEGTAKDTDVTGFQLIAPDNTVLATADKAVDRYVTLNLASPYSIPQSNNRTLTLKATIANGSGNYFRMQVQSDSDLMVKDKALGYYILPLDSDGGSWSAVTSANGYFKMKSGSLTLTKSAGSNSGNISAGASDVSLAKFDVRAVGEDIEIRKIGILIATTTGSKVLSGNVRLVMDGQTLLTFSAGYSTDLYVNGSQRSLSQYFTVKSGETKVLEVIGNIDSNATNETYQVKIGNFYGKRLSTLDFADAMPAATYTNNGNQLTVQTTNLSVSKDTSYPDNIVSKGATQIIGQYVVKAGNAEGVCVTNATLGLTGTFDSSNSFSWMELWNGTTQLGSRVNTVSTSSNSFSFNLCLEKNETKTITAKAYVLSGANDATGALNLSAYSYIGKDTNNSTSLTGQTNGGQSISLSAANLIITPANDSGTVSAIRLAGKTGQQIGKWKLEAENDDVTLTKITFTSRKELGAALTDSGNFGTLSLYDAANMTTPLATASYFSGDVQFTGLNLVVPNGSVKNLVLVTTVNAVINPASKVAFVVKSDGTDMEAKDTSGNTLGTSQIDATKGVNQVDTLFATSTVYLYHNAAPEIAESTFGTTLDLSATQRIFRVVITNNGNREMRLGTTTVTVSVSGLTTGVIDTFKFYEANSSGQAGTLLATNAVVTLSSSTVSSDVPFGAANQQGTLWNNLTIPAGSSRTFIVTANTVGMIGSKTSGVISVAAKISGSTGYSATAGTDGDQYWGDGKVLYYYTPAAGTENTTPYTASDSYEVNGTTLSKTL